MESTVRNDPNSRILQSHTHNSNQVFGNNLGFMGADNTVKFTVVGGDAEWGPELMIHDGTVVESGDATKKMDLNTVYVVSVSAANKISVMEFLYGTAGTKITGVTITDLTDLFTKAGSGLQNGDKVIVTDVVTTTGLTTSQVYFVIGVSGDTFQLSLAAGGAAVVVGGGDGTCSIQKLTQTSLSKLCISMANTNSDSVPFHIISPRVTCNQRLFVRAKSESGSTISIGFLLSLHTYSI